MTESTTQPIEWTDAARLDAIAKIVGNGNRVVTPPESDEIRWLAKMPDDWIRRNYDDKKRSPMPTI